jgi:PTH1 family peptidyl-tRNA hydrolase
MKLIVGLGNPGATYQRTLHNLGFDVMNELARRHEATFDASPADALLAKVRGLGVETVLLAKPLTFVNLSGRAVQDLRHYFKIEPVDLLVVTDDVNLPVGQLRARRGGSAGGHNGLKSIIEQLGTDQFPRLRVGVGRGDPRRDLRDRVLGRAEPEERVILAEATTLAADAVELFVTHGIADVMNRFNRRRAEEAGAAADEGPDQDPTKGPEDGVGE